MQNGSFLKFESDFQKFLPIFLSNLDCVLSTKSMEISISPLQKEPVFKSSKSNSWGFLAICHIFPKEIFNFPLKNNLL